MRRDDPGPYSLDALAALPKPAFFVTDQQALKARYVAFFEAASGRKLYPMQVEMLLIETLAYAMAMLGEEAQATAEEYLVSLAGLNGLLGLGGNRSTPRLPASKARVTVRFSLAEARAAPTVIPADRWIVAGDVLFSTLDQAVIAAGSLAADVVAEALVPGVAGNGFAVGQLSSLAEPIAGVNVTNIEVSTGGADVEEVEAYRLRVANAFDRVSAAGGIGWYREEVMAVSPAIIDVAVVRPQPCYVDIYPLTAAGPASLSLRDQVKAALSTARALEDRFGDEVTVKAAVQVIATPQLTLRMSRSASDANAADAEARARAVLEGWRQRLGAVIAPSDVEAAARAGGGVIDAEVSGLAFSQLDPHQYMDAALTTVVEWLDV